jgi:conjugal transfer pilus assembly protein TraD
MIEETEKGLIIRPWRSAYEVRAFSVWGFAFCYQAFFPLYAYTSLPALIAAFLSLLLMGASAVDIHDIYRRRILLFEQNLKLMSVDEFNSRVDASHEHIYLCSGWDWTQQQTQYAYDLVRTDVEKLRPPSFYMCFFSLITKRKFNATTRADVEREFDQRIEKAAKTNKAIESKTNERQRGVSWIHGMEPSKELYFPVDDAIGNTLICGTTRSGKTVMYRMLVRQIIRRGETLIVFDPKGDNDLLQIMLEACKDEGRLDQFVFFNPARPSLCHRIDPFANYSEPSQLASRVEPLIPSSGSNGDSFSKFAWGVMESILSAMDMINIRPSLKALRGVIERGPDELLYECIMAHCERVSIKDFRAQITAFEKSIGNSKSESPKRIQAAVRFYKDVVYGIKSNSAVDGLVGFYEHNREHATKMLASLMPILKQLTSGELGEILSPDATSNDPRPITSFDTIIRQGGVAYIGLHALGDATIANAISNIYMSDLVSSAASRYVSQEGGSKVVLLVDEASNAVGTSYIEMLNKGSGAGFINIAATQTIPDFVDALGSDAAAEKALGNFNNFISLRVRNESTKEYVSAQMGMTSIRTAQMSQTTSTIGGEDNLLLYSGTYGSRTSDVEAPLIDPQLLGSLPNMEFIANVSSGRILKGRVPVLVPDENVGLEDLMQGIPWVVDARCKRGFVS